MKGLTHLYYGDGKGKTTAGFGLALRFLGNGGSVTVARFLKSGASGECTMLEQLGATVLARHSVSKFTFQMTDAEKAQTRHDCEALLKDAAEASRGAGLILLDEAATAVSAGMLACDALLEFIARKLPDAELVITGHNPPDALIAVCDYVSHIQKISHPFDAGTKARRGIEW